jgi:transcription antitermination factor NusG
MPPDLNIVGLSLTTDAGTPICALAPCGSKRKTGEIFSKFRHGGARENSGGARVGAGRPRKQRLRCEVVVAPRPSLDTPRWFCVETIYGRAFDADKAMWDAGLTIFNPLVWLPAEPLHRRGAIVHPAKPDRVEQLFRGYCFVRFVLADMHWRRVHQLPGVKRLISRRAAMPGAPEIPVIVPDAAIDEVRARCAANDTIYEAPPLAAAPVPRARRFADFASLSSWMRDHAA